MPIDIHGIGLSAWSRIVWCTIVDRMQMRGATTISIGTQELTNILQADRKTIFRAIKTLEKKGLLIVKRGVPGQRNFYELPKGLIESGGDEGPLTSKVEEKAVSKKDHKAAPIRDQGGGVKEPLVDPLRHHITDQTEYRQTDRAAGAAAAVETQPVKKKENSQVRMALAKAGIGEPKITELANRPELTPDIVHEASRHNGGPGLTVTRIDGKLARAKQDAKERRQRQDHERKETAKREKENTEMQLDAYTARVRQALLQSITDEGLDSKWEKFIAEGKPYIVQRAVKMVAEGANRRALRSFASFVFKRHFGDKQPVPSAGTSLPGDTKPVEYPPDAQGHEHSVHPTTEAGENLEKKEKVNA